MRLVICQDAVLTAIKSAIGQSGLFFSGTSDESPLLCPAYVNLEPNDWAILQRDASSVRSLYRTANALYLASLRREAPDWISACAEYGLAPHEITAQRQVAAEGLEPVLGRIDYVTISGPARIAEVQWNSGGPGLLLGFADVHGSLLATQKAGASASLAESVLTTLATARPRPGSIINVVRRQWLSGEGFLTTVAGRLGIPYRAVERDLFVAGLAHAKGSRSSVRDSIGDVSVIYGQGYSREISPDHFDLLASASLARQVWLEAPYNQLYRQKWVLALPFHRDTAAAFGRESTDGIIPSVMLSTQGIDLSQCEQMFGRAWHSSMAQVRTIMDLLVLPESARRRLVLKCGAGSGPYYANGRGVFRLVGSRASARSVLDFIADRLREGEPWILQPFINDKHTVPLALPSALVPKETAVHMRVLVFTSYVGDNARVLGALANFDSSWKVTGKRASVDEKGRLLGSAFTCVA